jgi:hypothetical protein
MATSCLLFPALLSVAAFAQAGGPVNVWIPRGPEGGSVGRPVIDPQNPGTLYVAGDGKLFQTTDAAGHWSQVSAFSGTVLAVDPQDSSTLYSAGPPPLKSTDGGLTWNATGGLPQCIILSTLVIDPSNPSTVYVGCTGPMSTGGGGVFKSTDRGATWSAASVDLPVDQTVPSSPNIRIQALLIDPKNPSTLYALSAYPAGIFGGIFKSTDGAATWSSAYSGLPGNLIPFNSLAIDPQNPSTLYVVSGGMVAKSTDGAESWAIVSTKLDLQNLVVDPQDASTLYAISSNDVVKSTDGGASWSVVLSGYYEWSWVAVAPAAGGTSTVYAGGGWRGILKSSDGGVTWATANSGLIATDIDSLAIDPQNPRTLYALVNGAGLLKSTDGAASWSTPILAVAFAVAVDPRNEGTVYAWDGNGVRKSVDGGQSWVVLPLGSDDAGGLAIDSQSPGNIYYYYAEGYGYKSTDGGANWAKLSGFPGLISALATDPQDSGTLYAGSVAGQSGAADLTFSSGVLKSVDGGQSWSGVNTLWQAVGVSTIAVDPTNSNIVYAQTGDLDCEEYSCAANHRTDPEVVKAIGVYKSADGGATWVKLDVPGDPYTWLLGTDGQGALYAWVWSQAAFARSQDGGASWHLLPTTGLLPNAPIKTLAIDPQDANHLFAATYAGLFEIRLAP